MPVEVACEQCDTPFVAIARKTRRQRYCGRTCQGLAQRGPRPDFHPVRLDFPSDDEIVAAVEREGTLAGAARLFEFRSQTLGKHVNKRPELRRRVQDATDKLRYPSGDEIVGLASRLGNIAAVAREVGLSPSALQKYVAKQPELRRKVKAATYRPPAGKKPKARTRTWPLKYDVPPAHELVDLVRREDSVAGAENRLGLSRGVLTRRMQVDPELKRALLEVSRFARTATRYEYPPDDEIVAVMSREKTYKATARALDISAQAFFDYLKKRPDLKSRLRDHHLYEMAPEQRKERERERNRELKRKYPERRRQSTLWDFLSKRGGRPTTEEKEYVKLMLNDPCSYCGAPMQEIDHIVPYSRGGTARADNLAPACRRCNRTKSDRPLLHFLLAS